MPRVNLTNALKDEYVTLYNALEIDRHRFTWVDRIVDAIVVNKFRYEEVANALNLPWFVVAVIHSLESGLRFDRHLHNGDRLSARTIHVPTGRPRLGEPPFAWEESAQDALQLQRLDRIEAWPLERVLYELERYNGWGYRLFHPHVKSPYLWGFSNHYRSGKYIADGTWSDTARSKQCGAATLIRRLEERREISAFSRPSLRSPMYRYSNRVLSRADELQRFLNSFEGIVLRVDGKPGEKTSAAVEKVFGFYLQGDPRAAQP